MKKKTIRTRAVWLSFGATAVSASVTVIALRNNYETMVKLRSAVYKADETNGNVEEALKDLRNYVAHHMNTSISNGTGGIYPPIQLKYRYERLVAAQQASQNNTQVYSDAQQYCEGQNSTDFSGRNRVPCIEQYVSEHSAKPQQPIQESLYKYDFASAKWSPDVAGFGIIITGLLLVATVILFIAHLRHKRHHK